jgi:thiamine kinase-like enzyme
VANPHCQTCVHLAQLWDGWICSLDGQKDVRPVSALGSGAVTQAAAPGTWTTLSAAQRELVQAWLPGAEVVHDHSWGLVGTTVLEVEQDGARFTVKAGDDRDHHLARELRAHREWLRPWTTAGRAPQLVPTHGDWQPRNWLVQDGVVSVIDFGRADLRPALSDLGRLDAQDFAREPALEVAFIEGYGDDPREPAAWHRHRVREAIGTAAWAYAVDDEAFEAQGHRMLAELLPE